MIENEAIAWWLTARSLDEAIDMASIKLLVKEHKCC